MASDNEACCESDPNFAVICGFLEKFGVTCGLANIDFLDLQYMLENNLEVPQELIDLHVKLLRKARKSVSSERWERAVIKFCHGFCSQDAWEIERFGYKKARLSSKLRILKELLEMQFDYNTRFKTEVNKQTAEELRTQPLGKDRLGHVYWYQSDEACQIRVYKEDPDEESWALVVRSRDDLVNLITNLNDGKETVLNEDSNSLESEKPIIDTGQTDSNSDLSKPDQLEKVEESPEESSSESKEMDDDSTKKLVESEEELKATESTEAIDLQMKESQQAKNDSAEVEEKTNTPTAMVSPPKTGINLRIKPIGELLSTSTAGIKEKYIRSEPSSILSFVHHRKAVDSAGFDVHANYLKRPLSEVEDDEVPAYIKRSRMDRPTLLGNKKKKPYSEEEEEEEEEDADEEEEDEVSDEIEEPLMLVKGEGSGHDNKVGNFRVVSEEIVEDVIYFHGVGSGVDCETGNDNKDAEPQSTLKSVDESQEDSINQDRPSTSDQDSGSLVTSKTEFKLGTIIDVRTNNLPSPLTSPIKRSRWDIGKPSETVSAESLSVVTETKKLFECSNADNNVKQTINLFSAFQETPKGKVTELVTKFEQIDTKKDDENQDTVPVEPKRSMFFFGPGSLTVKPPNVTFKIGEFGGATSSKSDILSKHSELQGVDDSATSENAEPLSQTDDKEVLPSETLLSEESVSDNVQVEKLPENVETVEPTTHTQELPEKVVTDEVQNSENPSDIIQKSVDADQTTKTSLEISDKIEDSINTDEPSSEKVVKIDELPKDTLINKFQDSDKLLEEPTSLEVCQEIPFPIETAAVPSNMEISEEKSEPDLLAKPLELDTTESLEEEKQSESVDLLDKPMDTTEKSECIVSETKLLDDVIQKPQKEESVQKEPLDATNKSQEKDVIVVSQQTTIGLDVTDKSVDDRMTKNVSAPELFDLEKPEQKLTSEDTLLKGKPEDNSSPTNSPKKSFLIDKILDTKIIEEVPKEVSLKDTSIAELPEGSLLEGSNDEVKINLSGSTLELDDGPDKSNEETHEVGKIPEDLLQNDAVEKKRALEVGEKSQEPKDSKLDNKKPDFSSTKVPEMINTPQVLATVTEEIIKEVTSSQKDFILDKAENISIINSFDCKHSADQLSGVCKTDDYKSNDLNTDNETLSEESERSTKNVATVTECKPKIQVESVNEEFNKEETQKTDNLSLISSKNKETVDSNATKDVLHTDQLNFVSSKPENAQASISHENTEKSSSSEILPEEQSPLRNNLELIEKKELKPTEDIPPNIVETSNSSRQKKEPPVSSEELNPIVKHSESQKDVVVPENDIHVNSAEVEETVPKEKSVVNPEELNPPKDVQLPEVVEICKADSEKEVLKDAKVSSDKSTTEIHKEVPSISKEEAKVDYKPTENVQSEAVIASQTEAVNVPTKEANSEQSKPTQNVLPELEEQKVVDLTKEKKLAKPESEVKTKTLEVKKNTVEIKGKSSSTKLESGKSDVLDMKAADTNKASLTKPESGKIDDKKTKAVDTSSRKLRKPQSTESAGVTVKNVEIKETSLSKPENVEAGGVKSKALETKAMSLSKPENVEGGGMKSKALETKAMSLSKPENVEAGGVKSKALESKAMSLSKPENVEGGGVKSKALETKAMSLSKPESAEGGGVKSKALETKAMSLSKPESAEGGGVKSKAVETKAASLSKPENVEGGDVKSKPLETKAMSLSKSESAEGGGVKSKPLETKAMSLSKPESAEGGGVKSKAVETKAASLSKPENVEGGGVKGKALETKAMSLSKPENVEGGGVKSKALETKAASLSKPESAEGGGVKSKVLETKATSLNKPESAEGGGVKSKALETKVMSLRKPESAEGGGVKSKVLETKSTSLSKPESAEGGGVKSKALETKAMSLSKPVSEEGGGVKINVTEAKEKLNLRKSESEKREVAKNKIIEIKETRSSRKAEVEKEGVKIKTVTATETSSRKPESEKVAVVKITAVDMKSTLRKTDSVKNENLKINTIDMKQTGLRGFESEKSDAVKSTTVNTKEINIRKSGSGEGDSAKVKAADLKKEENKLKHSKDHDIEQSLDANLQDSSPKVSHITKSKKRKSSVQLNPKSNVSVQVEKKKEALEEKKIPNLEKNIQDVDEKLQETTKDVLDLHIKSTKEGKIVNVPVVSTVSVENNQEILDLANKSRSEITNPKLMDEPTSSPKKVKRNAPVVLDAGKTTNESNTSSIQEEVKPNDKSTKNANITDDKSSIGNEGVATTDITKKSVADEINTTEVQVTRRSTRKTRSNTFDKPAVENKKESTPNKVEENKNVKKAKKSVEKELPKSSPKIESEPVVETNKTESPKPNEIGEPPTRELRSRRSFPPTVKKAKAPTKAAANAAKKVQNEEEKSKVEDKNVSRSTRSNSQKGTPSKPIDLPELEKQITKAEVRPTKKFKMSESVENSPEKSESNKPNEEAPLEETPSPPRMRKTSARLRRSVNQAKKEEQAKTVEEPKVVEKPEEAKVTEESKAEEPKVVEESKNKVEDSGELIPVVEPPCVEKKVALLTVVDTSTLKEPDNADVTETPKEPNVHVIYSDESDDDHDFGDDNGGIADDNADTSDDDSDSVIIVPEDDPLAVTDLETEASKPPLMTLATFKLDADDSPTLSPVRVTRKRAAQQSVDALRENQRKSKRPQLERKDDDSKRPKLKPKRSVDLNLRRSIEQQKLKEVSSSEDDNAGTATKSKTSEDAASVSKRRSSTRSLKAVESDSETPKVENPPSADKKIKKTKRILLGLEISPEMENLLKDDTPVRQSRRIAQIKIKEEAERRKLEEVTLHDLKEEQRKRKVKKDVDKDYKLEKRKRNKASPTEDETTNDAIESDEKKKRKRKRKHWNPHKQFDVFKAWNSSSGSSSSEVEDEEEEIEDDDDHHVVLKSDHEFSPESDLEEGTEVQPLKRARTARKESDAEEEEVDDCACQKCGQKDHPEWILLCDSCDSGWHCSCLRPALLVIPEGDWFCPPCQHITLVKKLESQLLEYDKKMNKREMEIRRKERLAYVGISLDNVLPSKEPDEQHRHKSKHHEEAEPNPTKPGENYTEESGSDDTDSESESSSSTASDSDEPVYQLRERRQAHSYRFNDYDELINSAIQEEIDAVKGAGNQGRGKDIATIVNATQEEATAELAETKVDDPQEPNTNSEPTTQVEAPVVEPVEPEQLEPEPLPPIVPLDTSIKSPEPDSEEEIIRPIKKKMFGKKKHRKLNSLDVSSGDDDADSDEDFKGNSSSDSEEGEEDYSVSESSDESRRGKRRKGSGPIRRSTRARVSRYDKDFINDTDSGEEAPRRKKTRSIWDESESEESDGSWGGRGKRKPKRVSRKKPSMPSSSDKPRKSKKKKKRTGEDSDPEVFKKRPNIKFGGLNDDEEVGRRTRGKKINYLEALGSDSEDEMRRKPPRIEESEEEYIVQEDEEFKRKIENEKDSDESGPDAVLQDLAQMPHAKPKSRGRGKCGLKIPRKPKPDSEMGDMFSSVPPPAFHHSSDVFPPVPQDMFQSASFPPGPSDMYPTAPELYHNAGGVYPLNQQPPPLMDPGNPMQPSAYLMNQPILSNPHIQNQELHDIDDEPNPIEQINKNVEQMNEQEMEKMMEEEDYANKQLQLVALQLEKEKKRKEKEAQRLESVIQAEQKIPKKRGRKPKSLSLSGSDLISPYNDSSCLPMNSMMANNAELSEPPGISLPMFSDIVPALNADGTPRKRRGRGKGKKTLAAEAAALVPKDGTELEGLDCPSSSNSNTVSPAPDSPMHGSKLGIAAPPQPFSQSQPAPSVITRMLQSQSQPGAFSAKFFTSSPGDPSGPGPYHLGASGPRGLIPPGAYQQPPPGLPHYGVVRGAPPPLGIHPSGAPPPGLPPMYHAHRTLDPSPSGGGAITVSTSSRDRHSPSIASPSSSSPISKGEPTPPPPPYTRPQVGHFPPGSGSNTSIPLGGSRHVSMIPPPHLQHRSGSGSLSSPYHPGVPPNYHYGTYPPPSAHPPIGTDENQTPAVYPSAPYSENFIGDNGVPIPPSENSSGKPFEDDMGGEFVGLVSYFSSQREDDLDT